MRYGFKNAEEVKETSLKYNLHSWSVQGKLNPAVVEKAEGIYYYTADGKKMADMSSQLVNLNVGYGNKDIIDAIKEQAEKLAYISPAYAIDCRSKLAEMVVKVAPKNMGKVFFTLGGADANENAIKIAKLVTGRYKIFSRYRAYHGSSFGAGNLTGEPRRYTLEPGIPGFVKFTDPYLYHAPFPFESEEQATEYYLGQLRDQIIYENPDAVAAIVMESVTGSNGIIIPPKGYLQGVRKICDEFGIMMVCDEVMAGWGRTGEYFACENWGIEPDMITFAKGVTCGYAPLGGVIVSKKIAEFFDTHKLDCGLTYSAHPLGCAAGVACLNFYEKEHIMDKVKERGKQLGALLEDIKAKHKSVGDVRYIGLFSCVELTKDKATHEPLVPFGKDPEGIMGKIVGMLKAKGFNTYSHEACILVCPPLIITEEELAENMAILDEVLTEVDKMV